MTDEPLSHLRLRTGRDVTVIDVSDWGVLVEGAVRLLPSRHVDVHVVATDVGRILARMTVMRSAVSSLSREVVLYRSALVFERPIATGFHDERSAMTIQMAAGLGIAADDGDNASIVMDM